MAYTAEPYSPGEEYEYGNELVSDAQNDRERAEKHNRENLPDKPENKQTEEPKVPEYIDTIGTYHTFEIDEDIPHVDAEEFVQMTNQAERFPKASDAEIRAAKSVAKAEVKKSEYSLNGKTFLEAAKKVDEAVAKTDSIDIRETLNMARRNLVGLFGEELAYEIPLSKAITVYAGRDTNPDSFRGMEVMSVEKFAGFNRKDYIIRQYYLDQIANDADIYNEVRAEFNDAKKIYLRPAYYTEVIKIEEDVLTRYETVEKEWQEDPKNLEAQSKFKHPSMGQLMEWAINRQIQLQRTTRDGVLKSIRSEEVANVHAWAEFIFNQQNALIYHQETYDEKKALANIGDNEMHAIRDVAQLQEVYPNYWLENVGTPEAKETEKTYAAIALQASIVLQQMAKTKKFQETYYNAVTSPDGILVNKQKNEVCGAFEVKCYTKTEMEQLVTALKYGLDPENNLDPVTKEDNLGHYKLYGQEGFQVQLVQDPKHMSESPVLSLGFNPDAENRFVNMLRGVRPKELDYSQTPNYPGQDKNLFVLRVTSEIPDDLIMELGQTMQQYGYENFIIQRVTLEEDEIKEVAQIVIKNNLPALLAKAKTKKGRQILTDLASPEKWE